MTTTPARAPRSATIALAALLGLAAGAMLFGRGSDTAVADDSDKKPARVYDLRTATQTDTIRGGTVCQYKQCGAAEDEDERRGLKWVCGCA